MPKSHSQTISRKNSEDTLGIIGALATVVVVYDAIQSWKDPGRWWLSKVGSVVTALGCLGFVAFALILNLFDFSTRY